MTWKLGVTLFIMGAFAFGEETFEIRSILAFIILLFGIIVVIIGICYMKKDKTDDIIITDIRQDRDIHRQNSEEFAQNNEEANLGKKDYVF